MAEKRKTVSRLSGAEIAGPETPVGLVLGSQDATPLERVRSSSCEF